jgi:hypothetical protein
MKLQLQQGATSQRIVVFIQSSTATDGSGLSGLAYNTSGLVWNYWRPDAGNAGATPITPATATRGTWTSGGFVQIDSTNLIGFYELGIPNAVLSASNTPNWAVMQLSGAAGMVPVNIEIQLTGYNPNSTFGSQLQVKQDTALNDFMFPLFNSSGAVVTGATVTATRSINGASFASCTNSVTEVGSGFYTINLSASDLNGTVIALLFTASGAVSTAYTLVTQS